jgi:hypothetical protein
MTLKDVAGVFSRYFIVGFFAPAFFALFLVARIVDPALMPTDYHNAGGSDQVLVIGGAALLLSLLLSGIHYSVLRVFEGYPLNRLRDLRDTPRPTAGPSIPYIVTRNLLGPWASDRLQQLRPPLVRAGVTIYDLALWSARRRFDALVERREVPERSSDRTRAATAIARLYPDARKELLPTRFGNAIRSFERHPRQRYGLDGVTTWPRIELLLSDGERMLLSKAETDVAFFINSALLLPLMGLAFLADAIAHGGLGWPWWALYAVPFLAAYGAYRGAAAAAVRWGDPVRAAFDLHRLEFYRRLGVKRPLGPEAEKATARSVNRMLLFGEPLDAALRIEEDGPNES